MILDKHQIEAINALNNTFSIENKCLLKMFCGTSKTQTMF
jgi:predicted helicase